MGQFRIGGVYLDASGHLLKVIEDVKDVGTKLSSLFRAGAVYVKYMNQDGTFAVADGWRRKSDGKCFAIAGNELHHLSLLPGELTLRDGEWVPVEEEKEEGMQTTRLGALLRQALERGISKTPTLDKLESTSEPHRPALTWNKPTPFDPHRGMQFKVDRMDINMPSDPWKGNNHPLQRTSEGERNPAFGSAALVKG